MAIEFLTNSTGSYFWRLVKENGNVLCTSDSNFAELQPCKNNFYETVETMLGHIIDELQYREHEE